MITVITAAVLMSLVFYIGFEEPAEAIFGAFVGAILAFMVVLIIGSAGRNTEPVATRTNLVNLADGSEVSGSFFLGSGSIDQSPTYSWYEESGDNTFIRRDVPAGRAKIHYTLDRPHYVKTSDVPTGDCAFLQTWTFNMQGCDVYEDEDRYDFYIPKGSIKPAYELDAK